MKAISSPLASLSAIFRLLYSNPVSLGQVEPTDARIDKALHHSCCAAALLREGVSYVTGDSVEGVNPSTRCAVSCSMVPSCVSNGRG